MLGSTDFWVATSFIAFLGLLTFYKVPQLLAKMLDDRADAIRRELDEARKLRESAQELLADYQRRSREAEEEAKSIVELAKREAEVLAAETQRNLTEQLERRTKLAEEKIARAEAQALSEVRSVAVDVALAASEQILKSRVAGQSGATLIDQSIDDVRRKLN